MCFLFSLLFLTIFIFLSPHIKRAHWCPPCRRFTPKLCEAYKDLKASDTYKDQFELCFISSDHDEHSFNEYYNEMPFFALPYEERNVKQQLSKRFGITGIPSLLILGPVNPQTGDRPLINDNIRGYFDMDQHITEFPYLPKPYKDLAVDADGINTKKSLIIFCENEDDDEQHDMIELIKVVSEKWKKDNADDDDEMCFFYATQPGGAVDAIRKAIKIEKQLDGVIMALLDIPDNGGYYISTEKDDLNQEKVEAFLKNPGERQQLSPS